MKGECAILYHVSGFDCELGRTIGVSVASTGVSSIVCNVTCQYEWVNVPCQIHHVALVHGHVGRSESHVESIAVLVMG